MKLLIKIFFQTTCIILLVSSGIFLYTTYCWKNQSIQNINSYENFLEIVNELACPAEPVDLLTGSLKIKQAFPTIRNRIPTTKCAPK